MLTTRSEIEQDASGKALPAVPGPTKSETETRIRNQIDARSGAGPWPGRNTRFLTPDCAAEAKKGYFWGFLGPF